MARPERSVAKGGSNLGASRGKREHAEAAICVMVEEVA